LNLLFPANIKGIIFDLDGTLYRMKWFMKPLLTIKVFPYCLMLPRYMSVRKNYAGKEMHSGEKLVYAMAEKLSEKSGSSSEAVLYWINEKFYPAFINIMPLLRGSRPNIINTLKNLKGKGYKIAVLSDFAHVKERLEGLNIPLTVFDNIYSSESEGSLKPCTRLYFTIASSWKIKASEIAVIGDRDDTDGAAALNSGMFFVKISDKRKKKVNTHNWSTIKKSLSNLPSILENTTTT